MKAIPNIILSKQFICTIAEPKSRILCGNVCTTNHIAQFRFFGQVDLHAMMVHIQNYKGLLFGSNMDSSVLCNSLHVHINTSLLTPSVLKPVMSLWKHSFKKWMQFQQKMWLRFEFVGYICWGSDDGRKPDASF